MGKGGNESSAPATTSTGQFWLDSVYFWMARRQVKAYEDLEPSLQPQDLPWVQMAYAGTSIMLVCAAMEAHVNCLIAYAEKGVLPNPKGVPFRDLVPRRKRKNLPRRWRAACKWLTDEDLLDRARPPLRGFCEAVERRDRFVAHTRRNKQDYPRSSADWEEAQELTICNAKAALLAAQGTLAVVYEAMGKDLPTWVTSETDTPMPHWDVTVRPQALRLKVKLEMPESVGPVEQPGEYLWFTHRAEPIGGPNLS